jgi:hemoglobin-like flavoprotein
MAARSFTCRRQQSQEKMRAEAEDIVRRCWAAVEPRAEHVADSFYRRLFEIDETAAALFAATDMSLQKQKFIGMMSGIIAVLDEPSRLVHDVATSGARHVGYGVQSRHYETVGAALLWSLERELGAEWTPDADEAWREMYDLVAALMRRGAKHLDRGSAVPQAS